MYEVRRTRFSSLIFRTFYFCLSPYQLVNPFNLSTSFFSPYPHSLPARFTETMRLFIDSPPFHRLGNKHIPVNQRIMLNASVAREPTRGSLPAPAWSSLKNWYQSMYSERRSIARSRNSTTASYAAATDRS